MRPEQIDEFLGVECGYNLDGQLLDQLTQDLYVRLWGKVLDMCRFGFEQEIVICLGELDG